MVVRRQVLDQLCILVGELGDLLAQTDTRCIDDGKVAPKGLEQFNRARLKHSL